MLTAVAAVIKKVVGFIVFSRKDRVASDKNRFSSEFKRQTEINLKIFKINTNKPVYFFCVLVIR